MEKEVWKDIPGYEGLYQASQLGRVKRLARYSRTFRKDRADVQVAFLKEKMLSKVINDKGYYCISLHKDGKSTYFETHRAIAATFHNYTTEPYILNCDHIDNDKLNNRADNLQIVTVRKNSTKDKPSDFLGASFAKNVQKWKSSIALNNKDIYLGLFDTEREAHERYLEALVELEKTGNIKNGRKKQSSKYKGVSYLKKTKNWRAMLSYKKVRYYIGVFPTEFKAHKACKEFLKNLKK